MELPVQAAQPDLPRQNRSGAQVLPRVGRMDPEQTPSCPDHWEKEMAPSPDWELFTVNSSPSFSRQNTLAQHTAVLVLHSWHLPQQQNVPHDSLPNRSSSRNLMQPRLRKVSAKPSEALEEPSAVPIRVPSAPHWGVSSALPFPAGSPLVPLHHLPAAQGRIR